MFSTYTSAKLLKNTGPCIRNLFVVRLVCKAWRQLDLKFRDVGTE